LARPDQRQNKLTTACGDIPFDRSLSIKKGLSGIKTVLELDEGGPELLVHRDDPAGLALARPVLQEVAALS
jgi:hypothetical protein